MYRAPGDVDDTDYMITSYNDLCSFEGGDFIDWAYLALLDRLPDVGGKRYYLSRLRAGYSKIHILSQISRAAEKDGRGASLSGLGAKLRRHRIASVFGLAWIFRLFGYTEGNTRSERRDRALLFALADIRLQVGQLGTEIHGAGVRYGTQSETGAPRTQAAILAESEAEVAAPITRQARQTLNLGNQEFALPLSMDSRTRQLVAALEREILFAKKAI